MTQQKSQQAPKGETSARQIPCARCGKPTLFTSENPYRPFCSERCKLIDLGNWADGRYNIPINNPTDSPTDNPTEANESDDVDNQEQTSNQSED